MISNSKAKVANSLIHFVLILFSILTLFPFILTFIVSISDEKSVASKGYSFLPTAFSLEAYKIIFSDPLLYRAYGVTIIVTSVGTILSVILCALAGYAMSVKKVKYRNAFAIYFYLPMVFSAGLVPWYLVITKILLLKNTLFALILPGLISPFNIFLLRNYFNTIPASLAESAEIDGASPIKTYFRIIMPLSVPIFATVGLFISLYYWNDWALTLWFIDTRNLYPLQFVMFKINSLIAFLRSNGGQSAGSAGSIPSETIQVATLFATIGPIILVYPFVQKYFIKGIMIGAIKG